MGGRVGVQPGRICLDCSQENSVPLVYGMPGFEDFGQAERGGAVLGGCFMSEEPAASSAAVWPGGSESDPTAAEAGLTELLGVGNADVVRALGTGGRRGTAAHDEGVARFVSGEPAQVSIGVRGPWFVLARPLTAWGEERPGPLMGDDPRFTRNDVHHLPGLVADAAEAIASRRLGSFRWCRSCRRVHPSESFKGHAGACLQCADALADPGR